MKTLLGLVVIAMIAGLVLTPMLSNMETQAERARAARIAEETRLEQARAATVQVQADAFSLKSTALLPWGLLILGSVFVATVLVVLVVRPHRGTIDAVGQIPPALGQRPVYFVQSPDESPDAFLTRIAMAIADEARLLQ